jgi:hypothetical protein
VNTLRLFFIPAVTSVLTLGAAHAQTLHYTFENSALSGPETVAVNGYQEVTFVNTSDAELEMAVLKVRDGATPADVVFASEAISEAFATGVNTGEAISDFLKLADAIGGVNLAPQAQARIYVRLEPGQYVVEATSGGGPGETSTSSNMTVTVSEGEVTDAPEADFSLHMSDFHFDFPETMPAGEQLWEVSFTGQPHVALIFKLSEGATAEDVLAFMSNTEAGGPPPFEFGTLIPAASSGQTFYTPVSLSPGNYVAVCPLPDLAGEGSHAEHGMVDSFTVE